MSTKLRVLIVAGVLVAALALVLLLFVAVDARFFAPVLTKEDVLNEHGEIDTQKALRAMRRVADAHEAAAAHDIFVDVINEFPEYYDYHYLAHLGGKVLHEQVGAAALSVCGIEHDYGCLHQIVGSELTSKGEGAIEELNEVCNTQFDEPRRCQHGLGHGIMKHARHDVFAALDSCASLGKYGSFHGCQGGVFMEYTSQTLATIEGTETAEPLYAGKGMLYPCDEVPSVHKPICFQRLPYRWLNSGSAFDERDLARLCDQVPGIEDRQWCIRGIGFYTATKNSTEISLAQEQCLGLAPRDSVYCLQSVRWTHEGLEHLPEGTAEFLCEDLPQSERELCMTARPEGF